MSFYSGYPASYYVPYRPHKTYAEIETLLNTIVGLYDAVVYSTQLKVPLVPIDLGWLTHIIELSLYSHFGNVLSIYNGALYDNGGAEAKSFAEIDETTDLLWNSRIGMPEYLDALSFFRVTDCADSPNFVVLESVANDKMNVLTFATPGTTAASELAKTNDAMDWQQSFAAARASAHIGPWSKRAGNFTPGHIKEKLNVVSGPTIWDNKAALWLVKHFQNPVIPEKDPLGIGPDLIGSSKRPSGAVVEMGGPGMWSGKGKVSYDTKTGYSATYGSKPSQPTVPGSQRAYFAESTAATNWFTNWNNVWNDYAKQLETDWNKFWGK
jgi:hypothetical protein